MRSTFRVAFFLKRSSKNKKGEMPIFARITVDGKNSQFGIKQSINPSNWSMKFSRASGKTAETKKINNSLDTIKTTIKQHYLIELEKGNTVTAERMKELFFKKEEQSKTLIYFFDKFIEEYSGKVGIDTTRGTYTRYLLTKKRLISFMKHEYKKSDIAVKDITVNFIERFYLYLRTRYDCSHNTAIKFVQRFRTLIIHIKNTGLIINDPFGRYKISYQKTTRGYLNQQEVDCIYATVFPSKRLERARDVFIFSVYTGLSFIDVANLTKDKIKLGFDGNMWIISKRHKTNEDSNIRLLDIPKAILEKYKDRLPDEMILPIISHQKTNDYLKEIATYCGIRKNITFHIARHTFATTICISNGVPIETVSKLLGHTNIRTTQIYAKITDLKVSQDMNCLSQKIDYNIKPTMINKRLG